MIELIRKKIIHKKANRSLDQARKIFLNFFWREADNQWLLEDKHISRIVIDLFNQLDHKSYLHFVKRSLVIVPSSGELSCALGHDGSKDVIILFPGLIKKLRSAAPRDGQAILAHEIGHLINKHSYRILDRLKAQIEADEFACRLGYGEELQEILLKYPDIDCRTRVAYISSFLIQKKHA